MITINYKDKLSSKENSDIENDKSQMKISSYTKI